MRLANLSFRYARRAPWVLHDVRLDLPPGTVAEVTGRNGAGKSTLLRLLAGTTRPTRGAVSGRPPIVGYAPEIFPVEQPFTVSVYLSQMAAVRGVAASAIAPWAERLGMTQLLDVPLGDLSKGSAHKVGLAQALLAPPGLLVMDEPFSGLDAQTRAELPRIIEEVAADGGIVVVSDHQSGLAEYPGLTRLAVEHNAVRVLAPGEAPPSASPDPRPGGHAALPHPAGLGEHAVRASGTATLSPPEDAPAASGKAVIEVLVDADEAETVARRLRADGYDARLRP
ncbi:ABC transporter ATP-binding protein [Sphaerisporangium siamense]|uniref:ABC-type multidrug transport system ATPase subunit n=1 Tax=Sphaerisporangium siamense TaxID=795645 RepID=A0A7W7GBZ6_9ACTN|nr:ABC transporter ATP-binding protein [Sphaerisporangium siamense]MBB4705518.1 ABC-type multidrug transport system ATPase subunit [Sphaerisporangium siamense]GII83104.1 ABC transporter ATP-binding protein [Sphaerisporangium siamense]